MAELLVLAAATATNGKPSGSSAGVALRRTAAPTDQGFTDNTEEVEVLVFSSAGSNTMTTTIRLWGYIDHYVLNGAAVAVQKWFPIGPGADGTKGTLNNGLAMGETDTDIVTHSEILEGIMAFDRVYAEVTAIGGTSTAINVLLRRPKGGQS